MLAMLCPFNLMKGIKQTKMSCASAVWESNSVFLGLSSSITK